MKIDEIFWDTVGSEMDNHADTHCLDKICRPISFTSKEHSVAPFLSECSEVTNVPIGAGKLLYYCLVRDCGLESAWRELE